MRTLNLMFMLLLLFASCENRYPKPKGMLSEDKMVDILVDVHLTEAILLNESSYGANADSLTPYFNARLFHKHQVSRETFERSLSYYTHHPEEMNSMYEKVFNRISPLQGEVQAKGGHDEAYD